MKNKKIIFGVSIMCILVISITLILITNKSSSKVLDSNLENTTDNSDNKAPGMFAIMLETEAGSGQYQQSTSGLWPGSGYEFNSTLSKCENGGILTWNEENRTVNLKSNLSDRCYLYFYIVPPDVTIYTNNNDNYNPSTPATLSCSGATAEYNQKYQRIEISQINKYTNCNLTYQAPSSKQYLNDYIVGLVGSTQGNGQVVDEPSITIADFTNSTSLAQSGYSGTTMYSSTSSSATSGTTNTNSYTFNDGNWTSVSSNMTTSTYYHIKFKPSSSGYYQVCYSLSSGSFRNYLYIYKNSVQQGSAIQASTTDSRESCIGIGYADTSTDIRIVLYAYEASTGPISTLSFNVKKATSTKSSDIGIRYEGKNPNNYIWYNNELWRIIGVFDSSTHGQSGKNLVKIIRVNPIGSMSWNVLNINDWSESSLMNLLNGAYLNAQDGTNSEYCKTDRISLSNCDYTNVGIKSAYRNMIANVKWYLGGHSGANITAEDFYIREREINVYKNNSTEWNGEIGLMYVSDYGYSVLANSCARTTNLDSYNSLVCGGASWLQGIASSGEYTITQDLSASSYVFRIPNDAQVRSLSANTGFIVRPVLYLDSSVYVIDGNGTMADPYIIGV